MGGAFMVRRGSGGRRRSSAGRGRDVDVLYTTDWQPDHSFLRKRPRIKPALSLRRRSKAASSGQAESGIASVNRTASLELSSVPAILTRLRVNRVVPSRIQAGSSSITSILTAGSSVINQ